MKRLHALQALPGYLRRLARTSVVAAALGVPLGIGIVAFAPVAPASAQQPVESGIQRTYVNNLSVRLPIEIDQAQRAQLRGLVLFVKEGVQGQWRQIDQGAPQQTEFIFQAPREGEYWFRIVAIDSQGRSHPSDLAKDMQDAVVVVVDVTPPSVDVRFVGVANEGATVQCDCRDQNLDPLQTRFFFQTQDQVWRPLDPVPGRAGLYCIPSQAVLTNLIKVSATDLGRNTTTRTYNLGELAGGRAAAPGPLAAANAQTPYEQTLPAIPPYTPRPIPLPPPSSPRSQAQAHGQAAHGQAAHGQAPQMPLITNAGQPTPPVGSVLTTVSKSDGPPHDVNSVRPTSTNVGTLSKQPAAPTQIVGSPTVFLNYEIENQGASGVGKIEIWATSDQCRTWVKMVDDTTRKNPAELHFPGEGVFGVKLVASNGRGYGAEPPQSGDPADSWIEVDTTKPKAEIVAVQAGTGPESGVLTVFWRAEDKNLAADGIDLYFAASTDGPWLSIAKNVHNDKGIEGQYRWTPPSQAGAQSYLRLVVRDRAGNTAISQTVQPIPLDDLSRPRVRLLNVTTAPQPANAAPASLSAPAALRPGIIRPVQATSIPDLSSTSPTPTLPSITPNLTGVESR